MRALLIALFAFVLAAMLWVTTMASLDRSVVVAAIEIWDDPWSRAMLFDAYFGFLVVYVWIFWRERGPMARALWLVLLLTLGNLAIAAYFLRALLFAPQKDWRTIFPRREELPP